MTLTRRDLLRAAGLLGLSPAGAAAALGPPDEGSARGVLLNDIHSRLNPARVARVVPVASLKELRRAIREAAGGGRAVSIAGGRHAMGGQQFGDGTIHLDTRPMRRVLDFDREAGTIEVEAGIQWPELVDHYLRAQEGSERQWGIAQKQTGADRLTVGGALAANAHGRGLAMRPMVGDVESFTLVAPGGELHSCSRGQDQELFRLAVGGYGLFGPVYSVRLRLVPRRKLERVVEIRDTAGLAAAFEERIGQGFLYGDFQFDIDAASDGFLQRGVFACYRPADPATPVAADRRQLADQEWEELLYLAHADEAEAFRRYSSYYLSTSGQVYWSDLQQLGFYSDDYHRLLDHRLGGAAAGSEMITELYVPRSELAGFLEAAAGWLRAVGSEVVYGTVRLIERDGETFLPWARERYACTVLNLHVEHTPQGIDRAKEEFRGLIDLAAERDGSFFLTYHRWATRDQIQVCHPRIVEFLRLKRRYDPEERFQSTWYRHLRRMFADAL